MNVNKAQHNRMQHTLALLIVMLLFYGLKYHNGHEGVIGSQCIGIILYRTTY